ncbi:hypothetical protein [Kribbella sp. CA-293567]|uniref:hypothetical protein n=1 Tax=Kribbella sp. CA-293567 TaxID=3002436 RepID=UPI0022DD17C1|nr:hypothetical protein [Kribbella sp. CA-293567]WBQ02993.1 hypothetical protein OX958_23785 [Kribbella sp. CA-293567]
MTGSLMVDAQALGWRILLANGGLSSVEIDGEEYLLDPVVLMQASRIGGLPVGYGNHLFPTIQQAADGFAMWLQATVLPTPSDRVFKVDYLSLLEEAGFTVRPLEGVRNAHGICDGLQMVGLINPLPRRHEAATSPGTHRGAR